MKQNHSFYESLV